LEMERMIEEAVKAHLYLTRKTNVRTTKTKQFKRVLLEFNNNQSCKLEENTITIHADRADSFSDEYKEILKDFYLAF
ncbi:MAG: hypothetical protein QMB39_06230, partial [Bacteroidales bacterium]